MAADESQSVEIWNETGAGPVVLLCEHASSYMPDSFGGLGLSDAQRQSHIAWDPGAREVTLALSKALNAPAVMGRMSRLIYDCNRPPEDASAMPTRSETTHVPGNADLTEEQRAARIAQVYTPFCSAVNTLLTKRSAGGQPSVLVTLHSFTPVYFGAQREVELGILHDSDTRLADAMLAQASALPHRIIHRNDPYGPEDGVTHSLKIHGLAHGLPNVMIEIRNDLIKDSAGQDKLSNEILTLLQPALTQIEQSEAGHA